MIKSLSETFIIEKVIYKENNIQEIKLLNEDKLLIIDDVHFSIYNISTSTTIIKRYIFYLSICKTEITGKDKIMLTILDIDVIIYKFLKIELIILMT